MHICLPLPSWCVRGNLYMCVRNINARMSSVDLNYPRAFVRVHTVFCSWADIRMCICLLVPSLSGWCGYMSVWAETCTTDIYLFASLHTCVRKHTFLCMGKYTYVHLSAHTLFEWVVWTCICVCVNVRKTFICLSPHIRVYGCIYFSSACMGSHFAGCVDAPICERAVAAAHVSV